MKKMTIKSSVSMAETFDDFLLSRKAKGLTEKTLTTYKQHFSSNHEIRWHSMILCV